MLTNLYCKKYKKVLRVYLSNMSYITKIQDGKALKQLAKNNLNVHTALFNLPADLSGAGVVGRLIFPFKIHVIGLGLTNGAAPTGGVAIQETITDGTNAISISLGGTATSVEEAEDQTYEADTALTITNAAGLANASETACLLIHYIPILPTVR